MADNTPLFFEHKEVVTALLKEKGIHEGLWSLSIQFGITAANAGPNDDDLMPAAIVPVLKIGVQQTEKVNNLTVDAAEVNPPPASRKKRKSAEAG